MASDNRSMFEAICEQVERKRASLGVPGATFGVIADGETYTSGAGVTHHEHSLPVTDETLFQIGSITKTVTATALMRLAEQGKLDLRAPVRDYLPEFQVRDRDASLRVTAWHLLTHLAGWTGDVFKDTGANDDACEKYVAGMADYEQLAPLGTHFSYNNAAFCVAGRIIEVLTGATYEAAIDELILRPLGMAKSFFFPQQVMVHRFAVGHQMGDGGIRVLSPWAIPRGMNAAGGISCHIKDLLRYGAFHLGDGAPLMSAESLGEMHKRQARSLPYVGWCGLAWMVSGSAGEERLWHTGGTNGQNALLTVVPHRRLALGMMTNGDKGPELYDCFNRAVLREFCGIALPEPQPIELPSTELAAYTGRFQGTMHSIALKVENGRLVADILYRGGLPSDRVLDQNPPAAVAPCGPDQLLVLDGVYKGTRADFIRDDAGAICYLRFGSRLKPRLD